MIICHYVNLFSGLMTVFQLLEINLTLNRNYNTVLLSAKQHKQLKLLLIKANCLIGG